MSNTGCMSALLVSEFWVGLTWNPAPHRKVDYPVIFVETDKKRARPIVSRIAMSLAVPTKRGNKYLVELIRAHQKDILCWGYFYCVTEQPRNRLNQKNRSKMYTFIGSMS